MSKHKKNGKKDNTVNGKMNPVNDKRKNYKDTVESKWQPFDIDLARAILKGMLKGKFVLRNGEYVSISIKDSNTVICNMPYMYDTDNNGLVKSQFKIILNHLGRDEKGYQLLYILVEQDIKQENIQKEQTFKPFDKVLVRDTDDSEWTTGIYSHKDARRNCHIVNGFGWAICIQYKGNEHLIGTKNSPK